MKKTNGKVATFFRRNMVYLVLAFCILAVGLSMTLVIVNKGNDVTISDDRIPSDQTQNPPVNDEVVGDVPSDTPTETPDDTPSAPVVSVISFIMPVNSTEFNEYSETMVWNSTLGRFSSHTAMDFFAEEGSSVFAVYGGVVESVDTTLLEGVAIVIDHGEGLKTVYNSLADGEMVTVGQRVEQGDVIGEISITNRQEYKEGAHLHFEVLKDGQNINPVTYLDIAEK